jgi:histone deacetylase 6
MYPLTLYYNTQAMIQHVPDNEYMPERPERIVAIEAALKGTSVRQAIQEYTKTKDAPHLEARQTSVWKQCRTVEVEEPLSETVIRDAYGSGFVQRAHYLVPKDDEEIQMDPVCADVYWSHGTWTAARIAAAAAVKATQAALQTGESAFCVIRPPGHHCFDLPAGFCILNNVVLAAREVLAAGKRVAIVDWDYHFGDGTARALLNEPNAMFVSFHAARTAGGAPTYPANTRDNLKGTGLLKKTGGRSFNIQWDRDNADDAAMAYAFDHLLIPALQTFRPDVLLISAGFDAVRGDALAGMEITPAAFGYMARRLGEVGVPVVAVLEGGYDTLLLAECVEHTVRGMLGDDMYAWSEWKRGDVREEHREVVEDLKVLRGDVS